VTTDTVFAALERLSVPHGLRESPSIKLGAA
jgi:hypothetical protein